VHQALSPQLRAPSSELRGPSPCAATLAICSDLDETPDAETYFEIIRFLTTTEETRMGPGVGLEIGNSIYFDMPPGQFSYWNTTDENREKIRALIRSGHIDVLHSFGDLATTRAHAARALEELAKHGCYLKVWVDHAQAPTNFGSDIMQGHGDEPGHPAYHADLTLSYGIRYVWRGRVTSYIGQNQPFRLRHLIADTFLAAARHLRHGPYSMPQAPSPVPQAPSPKLHAPCSTLHAPSPMPDGPCPMPHASCASFQLPAPSFQLPAPSSVLCLLSSGRTILKEYFKHLLGRLGNRKYGMHGPNRVLAPCRLRDGSQVLEFIRCNPHWAGVSCGDRGDHIHEVLTRHFLDRLVERRGVCILYTHLGKLDHGPDPRRLSPEAVAAFRLLAEYHRAGKIWVTTTARLLDYLSMGHGAWSMGREVCSRRREEAERRL
jgi:hypothetical protein